MDHNYMAGDEVRVAWHDPLMDVAGGPSWTLEMEDFLGRVGTVESADNSIVFVRFHSSDPDAHGCFWYTPACLEPAHLQADGQKRQLESVQRFVQALDRFGKEAQ